IFGAAALPLYAICAAYMFDLVERSDLVETSSGLLLGHSVGAIIGPLIASFFMRFTGPGGLFLTTGGAHLLLAAFVIWRMMTQPAPSRDQHSEFDLTRTAPTVAALMPTDTPSDAAAASAPGHL